MPRKLFCELSPLTYAISVRRQICMRKMKMAFDKTPYAKERLRQPLPYVVYAHKSLIRRTLGQVDVRLQHNKAHNLALAAPRVTGILIRPGEVFSFWKLVGPCTRRRGYKEGLVISRGQPGCGVGGGMCQFTNLIHWLVLHTPLDIVEHHHHNGLDLFPDFGRQVPFGTGTSIFYNYLDYRFKNNTDRTFQLVVGTDDQYLWGELRCESELSCRYHVEERESRFVSRDGRYYRQNAVYRRCVDKATGNTLEDRLLIKNDALVMYDSSYIDPALIR